MPFVTYRANEIAYVAAALARALPGAGADFEMLDLLLERALDQLRGRLSPDVLMEIERLRSTRQRLQ